MLQRNFYELAKKANRAGKYLCVGLDTNYLKISQLIKDGSSDLDFAKSCGDDLELVVAYNKMVIDQTHQIAGAYKLNRAFYDLLGKAAFEAIAQTIAYIHQVAPHIGVIFDAKYGDIGSTNEGYVQSTLELGADAVTISPYLGRVASQPFLDQKDLGVYVLIKTSNPGSDEFQNINIGEVLMYEQIAENLSRDWNTHGNVGGVAGATYPAEAVKIRQIVGDQFSLLIPGVGEQGQTVDKIIPGVLMSHQSGFINSSRGIIFAKTSPGQTQAEAIKQAAENLDREIRQQQNKK